MIGTKNTFALIGIGGLALFGATACNVSFAFDTEGSGVAETVTYDFDSFDEVDISGIFQADITIVDGPPTVEITVDDNLVEKLEVEVKNGELDIDMKGSNTFNVDPVVVITMPDIVQLDTSGAASATVTGAKSSGLTVDFSGASDVEIDGTVPSLDLDGSGGASIAFTGSATTVEMDLSGASYADFDDAVVGDVVVDFSGGSSADFGDIQRISGDLSGASSANVPEGTTVSTETSGGASVDRN